MASNVPPGANAGVNLGDVIALYGNLPLPLRRHIDSILGQLLERLLGSLFGSIGPSAPPPAPSVVNPLPPDPIPVRPPPPPVLQGVSSVEVEIVKEKHVSDKSFSPSDRLREINAGQANLGGSAGCDFWVKATTAGRELPDSLAHQTEWEVRAIGKDGVEVARASITGPAGGAVPVGAQDSNTSVLTGGLAYWHATRGFGQQFMLRGHEGTVEVTFRVGEVEVEKVFRAE